MEDIQDNAVDKVYHVRAHVRHSLRKEKPLNVKFALSLLSGYVGHGSCDCIASSTGRFAHVAAVLFSFEKQKKQGGKGLQLMC